MNARAEILARLRRSHDPSASLPDLRSPSPLSGDPIPLFVDRATSVGMQVRRSGAEAWVGLVGDELQQRGVRSVAMWEDPILAPLTSGLLERRIAVVSGNGQIQGRLRDVEAGITSASFGIALSGTLVLVCDAQRPRSTSLLPPLHVAVLPVDRIVPTLGHLFAGLTQPLPSALTFITGPSRTSDIEMTPVRGVHGPTEVIVYLII